MGTSGQRIADSWKMDSFGMAELLDSGILGCGDDVARFARITRQHGDSVGWLLEVDYEC